MKSWTMKSLNSFKIGTRVLSTFTLATLISAVVIFSQSYDFYTALVARDQAVKISFDAQQTANVQQVSLQRMNALLQTRFAQVFATMSGSIADPSLQASGALTTSDILDRETDFKQTLQSYQQNFVLAVSPNMQGVRAIILSDDPNNTISQTQQDALRAVAHAEWPTYKALQDQVLRLLNPGTNPLLATNLRLAYANAYLTLYKADQTFLTLELDWQQVVDSAQIMGEVVTNVGPSQTQPIVQTTVIALLLILLIITMAGFVVNLTITRPLRQLAALTQRIAAGENNVRAPVRGRDEIAQVAHAMNNMLNSIVTLVQQSEGQRAQLQLHVEQLINQVHGVSQGDLRAHASVTLPELETLATSFNFMVEAFSRLIRHVKGVSAHVVASTMQTAQAMQQVTSSAEHHITQIQEASGAVEQMTAASQYIAQRAEDLSLIAATAQETAHQGALSAHMTVDGITSVNAAMKRTLQSVQGMYHASSEIDEIANVMAGLAQKTRRLSLDATIQVSLAGATNSGFAKVVEDIGRLAEQAKADAERIRTMVRAIVSEMTEVRRTTLLTSQETEKMTITATKTGMALAATVTAVTEQATGIQEMAQVATAQVPASRAVVTVMHSVSHATRENRDLLDGVVQHITLQRQDVLHLRTSVAAFKVSDAASQHGSDLVVSGRHA